MSKAWFPSGIGCPLDVDDVLEPSPVAEEATGLGAEDEGAARAGHAPQPQAEPADAPPPGADDDVRTGREVSGTDRDTGVRPRRPVLTGAKHDADSTPPSPTGSRRRWRRPT